MQLLCLVGAIVLLENFSLSESCSSRTLLRNTTGIITDGPSNYNISSHCEWLIGNGTNYISLVFTQMATECSYDYIFVYDGKSYDSPMLGSFSGDSLPSPITAYSGYMLVYFFSDRSYVRKGFNATYSIDSCPRNCNGRGDCVSGKCLCKGFDGTDCSEERCPGGLCGDHGDCDFGLQRCVCHEGWVGQGCTLKWHASAPPQWHRVVQSTSIFPPRSGHSLALVNSTKLFVFGGFNFERIFDDMYYFELRHNSPQRWQKVVKREPWPSGRHAHAAVTIGTSFYIYGGVLSSGSFSNQLWQYQDDKWTLLRNGSRDPGRLTGHTLTAVGNLLYVIGGRTKEGVFASAIWSYDVTASTGWRKVDLHYGYDGQRRLVGHSAVYHESSSSIIIFGGFSPDNAKYSIRGTDIYMFHIEKRRWTKLVLSKWFQVVYGGNAHVHNVEEICYDDEIYFFNIPCARWVNYTLLMNSKKASNQKSVRENLGILGRFGHASVIANGNTLLSVGGYRGTMLGDVVAYTVPKAVLLSTLSSGASRSAAPSVSSIGSTPPPITTFCSFYASSTSCVEDVNCMWCSKLTEGGSEAGCREKRQPCFDGIIRASCPGIFAAFHTCSACATWGAAFDCGWCVKEAVCQRLTAPAGTCLSEKDTPSGLVGWWDGNSTTVTNQSDCVINNAPAGLSLLTYENPPNWSRPDAVEIVRETQASLRYDNRIGVEKNGVFTARLLGYIHPNGAATMNGSPLKLQVSGNNAKVTLKLSTDDNEKNLQTLATLNEKASSSETEARRSKGGEQVFANEARGFKYSIELTGTQTMLPMTQPQRELTMALEWTGALKHLSFHQLRQKLTFEFLSPLASGSCSTNTNCIACLADSSCFWCAESSSCLLRSSANSVTCPKVTQLLNATECPSCADHISCASCVADDVTADACEWLVKSARCVRRGRFAQAIKNVTSCPSACRAITSCAGCVQEENECAWCESTSKCFPFLEYVLAHSHGGCTNWVDGIGIQKCSDCSRHVTCKSCEQHVECGWCGNQNNPTIGVCERGDFNGMYNKSTSCSAIVQQKVHINESIVNLTTIDALWNYGQCPDVDECRLDLHNCHGNATCVNNPDSFECVCNPGFKGDGKKNCERTCLHKCAPGRGLCSGFPDYVCNCHVGSTGTDCATDCGCNSHSNCSVEVGVCDRCIHGTTGSTCDRCLPGHYGNASLSAGCKRCDCNGHGDASRGVCDNTTGHCFCTEDTLGKNCQMCPDTHFGDPRNGGRCYWKCDGRNIIANVTSGALGTSAGSGIARHSFCVWVITTNTKLTPSSGSVVKTLSIRIESGMKTKCGENHIYMWDGLPKQLVPKSFPKAKFLASFCGTRQRNSNIVTSSTGVLVVFFRGNLNQEFSGFNASFAQCFPQCSYSICDVVCNNTKGSPVTENYTFSRFAHSLVASGDKRHLYLFGGYSLSRGILSDLHKYDVIAGRWTVMRTLTGPKSRYHHSATCFHDVMYMYGGILTTGSTNEFWFYHTTSHYWRRLTSRVTINGNMSELPKVAGHTLTLISNNKLLLLGGMDTSRYFSKGAYVFDLHRQRWEELEVKGTKPTGIYCHSAIFDRTSNAVYVFGGLSYETDVFTTTNLLRVLDLEDNTWSILPPGNNAAALQVPPPRLFHDAVIPSSKYFAIIGGEDATTSSPNGPVYLYWPNCNHWSKMADKVSNFVGQRAAVVGNTVYTVGGFDGTTLGFFQEMALPADPCHMMNGNASACVLQVGCSACMSANQTFCFNGFDGKAVHSCGINNSTLLTGIGCNENRLEGRNCAIQKSCSACLAKWPAFRTAKPVCHWCSNCHIGMCIPLASDCQEMNQCEGKVQKPVSDVELCVERKCQASTCEDCSALKGCMWTRQFKRSSEIGRTLSLVPIYNWNCVSDKLLKATQFPIHSSPPNPCPARCATHSTCATCLRAAGADGGAKQCVWSVTLRQCITPAALPLRCYSGQCGVIIRQSSTSGMEAASSLCPVDCTLMTTCATCLKTPSCGWCAIGGLNGQGVCIEGGVLEPLDAICSQWNISLNKRPLPANARNWTRIARGAPTWNFLRCPPENECENFHHNCQSHEKCKDLEEGFECNCQEGYKRATNSKKCLPVCENLCENNGVCVAPNKCECKLGYIGDRCQVKCSCNRHSNCLSIHRTDVCLNCTNNTQGKDCGQCKAFYAGDPTDGGSCTDCMDLCNNHSRLCLAKSHASLEQLRHFLLYKGMNSLHPTESARLLLGRGPMAPENAQCLGCQHNTDGPKCENCQRGFYRIHDATDDIARLPCQRCVCNGHGTVCDQESGDNCYCRNNTKSPICDGDKDALSCHAKQCSLCKENFLGTPTDGHQCYRHMSVDSEYCFDPATQINCNFHRRTPLVAGQTVFFGVQPKYLNVDIRIFIDVSFGGIDVYFSPFEDTFRVVVQPDTGHHEVRLDSKYRVSGVRSRRLRDIGETSTTAGANASFLHTTYQLLDQKADSFITFLKVANKDTFIIVRDVQNRLVITLPNIIHPLQISRYYVILQGKGKWSNGTLGQLYFRQDQPHIDLFVFFSVFFSCFFLFLAMCVLLWKVKQAVDASQRTQLRRIEMECMASRPFAKVLAFIDSPQQPIAPDKPEKLSLCTQMSMKNFRIENSAVTSSSRLSLNSSDSSECFKPTSTDICKAASPFRIIPVAMEGTDDGIAAVATVCLKLPGERYERLALGSALVTQRQLLPGLRRRVHNQPGSSAC